MAGEKRKWSIFHEWRDKVHLLRISTLVNLLGISDTYRNLSQRFPAKKYIWGPNTCGTNCKTHNSNVHQGGGTSHHITMVTAADAQFVFISSTTLLGFIIEQNTNDCESISKHTSDRDGISKYQYRDNHSNGTFCISKHLKNQQNTKHQQTLLL